jgi:hypothetical protein
MLCPTSCSTILVGMYVAGCRLFTVTSAAGSSPASVNPDVIWASLLCP